MNIVDATVYGVQVPYCEGRAGMIAVALAEDTNSSVSFDFVINIISIFGTSI